MWIRSSTVNVNSQIRSIWSNTVNVNTVKYGQYQ
jgi:hypothetical protein